MNSHNFNSLLILIFGYYFQKILYNSGIIFMIKKMYFGTSLVVQWLGFHASNAGGLGLISDWGTRSHMPQQRVCMLQLRSNTAK